MDNLEKTLTDKDGMPTAVGQPYPASEKEFVTPVPKKKTGDTSRSEEVQKACWEGYVQRGMKPGDNGGMVPNCVPISKADDEEIFSDFGKDYTKSTRIV
jgi:hypothetical protein